MMGTHVLQWLHENHRGEYSVEGRLVSRLFYGIVHCLRCDREIQADSYNVRRHFEGRTHHLHAEGAR